MNKYKAKQIRSPLLVNKFKTNLKKYLIIWGAFFIAVFCMGASCSYNDAVFEYIEASNPFKNIFRNIGWLALKWSAILLDGLYEAITKLLTLDFLHDIPGINQLYNVMTPISWGILSVSIIVLGIMLMVFHDKFRVSEGIKSFLLAVILIVGMPTIITTFEEFKNASVTDMSGQLSHIGEGGGTRDTVGQAILKSITVDVEATQKSGNVSQITVNPYIVSAEAVFDSDDEIFNQKIQQHGTDQELVYDPAAYKILGMDYLTAMQIARDVERAEWLGDESVNYGTMQMIKGSNSIYAGNIYSYTTDSEGVKTEENKENGKRSYLSLVSECQSDIASRIKTSEVTKNGTRFIAAPLSQGNLLSIFDEHIYRYQPNFLFGIIIIVISLLAMIFAGFKITSLLFDVLFNQLLAPIALATDVTGSGRGKKMLQNLISSYIVFLIILVLLKMYLEITTWASSTDFGLGDNLALIVVMRILIIGGAAKGMIDGPDIIPRILGIDAGIKSGMGAALATWGVAKGAGKVAKGAVRGVKALGTTAAKAASAAVAQPHKNSSNNNMANRSNGNNGQHPALNSGGISPFGASGLSADSGGTSANENNVSQGGTKSAGNANLGSSSSGGTSASRNGVNTVNGRRTSPNRISSAGSGTASSGGNVPAGSVTGTGGSTSSLSGSPSGTTVTPHKDTGKSYTSNKPMPVPGKTNTSSSNTSGSASSVTAASYHGTSPSSGFAHSGSSSTGTKTSGTSSGGGSTAYHGSSSSSGLASHSAVNSGAKASNSAMPSGGSSTAYHGASSSSGFAPSSSSNYEAKTFGSASSSGGASTSYHGASSSGSQSVSTPSYSASTTSVSSVTSGVSASAVSSPASSVNNVPQATLQTTASVTPAVQTSASSAQTVTANPSVQTSAVQQTVTSPQNPVSHSSGTASSASTSTTTGKSISSVSKTITTESTEHTESKDSSPTALRNAINTASENRRIKKKYNKKKGGKK